MADGRINPANVPDIALKDGQSIPQVGFGVLRIDEEGLARTLGVCNFMPADLKRLHEETGAWPAVNQIELHNPCGVCVAKASLKRRLSRVSWTRSGMI